MNTKLILLTVTVSIIFYIIRFHLFNFSESRKVTMNVVSNSEQNLRHNYEKYGIIGLIGMIGIILFILINFFERPFYLTQAISDVFKTTLK
jgi:uncharacterized membrane protein